eukprot:SAG31_NODE_386_length_16407_cov_24.639686_1_plen_2149_part_00
MLLLRPISEAQASKDNVVATLRGSAINQDGRSSGITAPNGPSQQNCIRFALAKAGVTAAAVGYVEAHGTGTSLGDPIEVDALAAVMRDGRSDSETYFLGSVKTNIGHLEGAAGASGLCKLVLSVQNAALPAHLNFKTENPHLSLSRARAVLPLEKTEWNSTAPRIGGVSSFGFSGTNGHVVVEQSPSEAVQPPGLDRNGHVFTISAKTERALIDLARRYADYFATHADVELGDVCYTANTGRAKLAHRLAVTVTSVNELQSRLRAFLEGDSEAVVRGFVEEKVPPKVVFVFTGHASQVSGVSRELYDSHPMFREQLDACAAVSKKISAGDVLSELFADAPAGPAALFALQFSLAQLWMSWGVMPAVVTGSGVNEYVAACIGGVFSVEDGMKLAVADASGQDDTATASVTASAQQVTPILRDHPGVIIAAQTSSGTVISGSETSVSTASEALAAHGFQCKLAPAPYAGARNSPTDLQSLLTSAQLAAPRIPVVPASTGKIAAQDTLTKVSYWMNRTSQSSQFVGPVEQLIQDKYSVFVEIGPTSAGTYFGQQLQGTLQNALWLPSMGQRTLATQTPTIFKSLSQLFTRGGQVDFAGFDAPYSRNKILLPTYPYQRERYWVSGLVGSAQNVADNHLKAAVEYGLSKPINKLLGRQINTPYVSETIFMSHFSVDEGCLPVIADHIINGFLIVPAVFDVGTVLEAHNYMLGPGSRVLEGVTIPAALVLNDVASKPVQLIVSQTSDTELDWQLVSYKAGPPDDPDSWLGNASGKMKVDLTQTSRINETIEEIKARCDVEQTKADFYTYMYGNEYELGGGPGGNCLGTWHGEGTGKGDGVGKWDYNSPNHGRGGHGFQLVNHIWRNGSEALCELVVEPASVTAGYQLYPVYFDCCIQIIASIVSSLPGAGGVSYVPIAIEKFILHKTPEDGVPLYCHTKLQGEGNFLESETIGAMMCVMGADGDIFAEAINFRVKKAGKEALAAALKEDLSSYYYNIEWNSAQLTDPAKKNTSGLWLVFTDTISGGEIVSKLESDGASVVVVKPGASYSESASHATIRPDQPEDYEKLFNSSSWVHTSCVGVVHMWSMDNATDAEPTLDSISAATRVGTKSLLYLTQATLKMKSMPKIWIVTRGTQATGSEPTGLAVAQSPAWGFGKVLALEARKTEAVRIDVGLESQQGEEAQQIFDEITNETGEQEVAFRGTERKVARLVQRKRDAPGSMKLSADGNYLITGGFGALGLIVAKLLVERGARRLILMSRRGPPDSAADALQELKDMGAVLTPGTADVSDTAQMAEIFSAAQKSGHPVVGVVHSAGVIEDKMLADLDWGSFERVMAAKVAGACNLNAHMTAENDKFFVLFSSASSAIGNVGQANYAAANAFLDSMAHHRMAKGLPGLSVNWGPWADIGMAASIDASTFESTGLGLIKPAKGLDILEQCIVQTLSAQVVVAPVTWSTYLSRMGKSVPALFATMAAGQEKAATSGSKKKVKKSAGGGASEAASALIKRLLAVPESKRISVLSAMIQKNVMEVLGVTDPSAVGLKQALSELGMDSLMAVDVQNVLAEMVGTTLPGTLLFDYPSIDSIANYLLDEVLELTEEDEAGGGSGGLSEEALAKMRGEPIAISGMSARMPGGGDTPELFWTNLSSGMILTRSVPKDRWDHSVCYDPDPDVPGKAYTDQGGFLTFDLRKFDASFFGISNREADHMDPQQRMLLEVSWEAIEAAGIAADSLVNSRTGVNLGICGYDYCLLGTRTNDLAGIVGYTGTGVAWSVAAGRISYTFGFKGPAFTVDTACSSGLLATHMACADLKSGVTNYAVAGGVNLLLAPDLYVNFSKARMLSPNGRCATFDETADGFCRAEGCSMLLLRRSSEAEAAGDRIQALLRGTATNQDGRSNSLTAPNGPSQQAVIKESLAAAGLEPNAVSYLECHGTGTSLGDPIEVIAAANVLSQGRSKDAPLILGSVKAPAGHLEGAAGSSGLTKIIMCMKYEMIPPQCHFNVLNDMITIDHIPGIIPLKLTPWSTADNTLIADVSSFGFGGSNVHATVQKYRAPEPATNSIDRPLSVLALSAASEPALLDLAAKYVDYCRDEAQSLEDTCFTAATGRQHFASRVAIPCASLQGAVAGLTEYIDSGGTKSTAHAFAGKVEGNSGMRFHR